MPFYKKPHRDTIIANSAATLSDIDVSSGVSTLGSSEAIVDPNATSVNKLAIVDG